MFGFDDPAVAMKEQLKELEEEEDEWQDIEISEQWGPDTPMTPLNNERDDIMDSRQQVSH